MKRMSLTDIHNCMAEKKTAQSRDKEAQAVLRELSAAISDLQVAGIDVKVEVFPLPNKILSLQRVSMAIPFSGIIHIGNHQCMFGIVTSMNNTACLKMILAETDYRFLNGKDMRLLSVNFGGTPDLALISVQRHIIEIAARNDAINENDICGVFEKSPGVVAKKIIKRNQVPGGK